MSDRWQYQKTLNHFKSKYDNFPYKPIRVKPHDKIVYRYPIMIDFWNQQIHKYHYQRNGEYKQKKYNYLIKVKEDFWFPSQSITPLVQFMPGSVKATVQFELNKGYFDIWDKNSEYKDQWLSFEEWIAGYKYGSGTDISEYYLEESNQEYLELEPKWDNKHIWN